MDEFEQSKHTWTKSTRSGAAGHCVEVATDGDSHYFRDSKDQGKGPVLTFNPAEMTAFIEGVKAGEFDL